jgi:spore maturation protein A
MLNKIWFWLLLIGISAGAGKGVSYAAKGQMPPYLAEAAANAGESAPPAEDLSAESASDANRNGVPDGGEGKRVKAAVVLRAAGEHLTGEALDAAKTAVMLCIGLIGIMALWLGMMNIARDAGLVDALARVMKPAMRWLFPDVPEGHPAQGSMLMNMAANMLGMGNAATPFGLKAMKDLQTLNRSEDTCTNAMAMFLAINTSSVTLIPVTLIGIRSAAGSTNVAAPLAGLIMATTVSTVTAIVATKLLQRAPGYNLPEPPVTPDDSPSPAGEGAG